MNEKIGIRIESDYSQISIVWDKIAELLKDSKLSGDALFDIRLSAEEAMVNAIKYGNKFDRRLFVEVAVFHNGKKVEIAVKDQGKGFDYKNLPDPTVNDNLAKPYGRGIFLIKRLMNEVRFNESGNEITMVKYIKGGCDGDKGKEVRR